MCISYWVPLELSQLYVIILFPFLHAKDLRTSLLIIQTHIFLLSFTYGVHTQG